MAPEHGRECSLKLVHVKTRVANLSENPLNFSLIIQSLKKDLLSFVSIVTVRLELRNEFSLDGFR